MKDFILEEKLAQLRNKYRETTDPITRAIIERQAKALELARDKTSDLFRKIFK